MRRVIHAAEHNSLGDLADVEAKQQRACSDAADEPLQQPVRQLLGNQSAAAERRPVEQFEGPSEQGGRAHQEVSHESL